VHFLLAGLCCEPRSVLHPLPLGSLLMLMHRADDDPEDMLRKFRNANFVLRAPLIDREGVIVGVINPQDVLRQQEIEDTDDMLRYRSAPAHTLNKMLMDSHVPNTLVDTYDVGSASKVLEIHQLKIALSTF
jgi:hypothetical protein